ncbi:uncharacterized protein SCHCODRAFT_02499860 [Schizophyllum commune H4-8]|uniref:uncharacterized protein n=1 Tax=Schizophyllum commune (strain H4-8 / FGSC 9210) TaxID=578458 RepID=UPI002160F205|nr:uncharacterized protein SCHCODRAFT_02499860 [Schizophyllum commune H4-8]KAI5892974.1 hypothetical protein SCHCODRAFT_02499860 [Schizophyllum commune H4-8]
MKFAARHNYMDILDAAAPHAIGTDLKTMKEILPASLILPWVTFNDAYNQIALGLPGTLSSEVHIDEEAPNAHYNDYHDTYEACKLGDKRAEIWRSIQRDIALVVVDGGAQNLRSLDRLFSIDLFQRVAACDWCHGALLGYKFNTERQMKALRAKHPFSSYLSYPRVDALRRRNEALAKEKEAIEVDKEALRIELQRAVDARARAEAEAAEARNVAVQAGQRAAEAAERSANAFRGLVVANDEIRQLRGEVSRLQDEAEATQKELLRAQRRARRLFKRLEQARAILHAGEDDDDDGSEEEGGIDVEMQEYKIDQQPDVPPTLTPPPEAQPLPSAAAYGAAPAEDGEGAIPPPAGAPLSIPATDSRAENSPRDPPPLVAPESYASTSAPFSIQTSRAITLPTLLGVQSPPQANPDEATEPTDNASTSKKRKWTTTIMKTWVGTNPSTTAPDLEVRDPKARARLDRK